VGIVSRRFVSFALPLLFAASISTLAVRVHAAPAFEDSWIRVELPKGWTIDGEAGEYMLESDTEDIASLLVLAADPERTLEEVLADIEEQFLSTGMFTLEATDERQVDGEPVHLRRYRVTGGPGRGEDAAATVHHQYSFWRDDVHVLLEVETGVKSAAPERLFSKVFSTLQVLEPPVPFLYEDYGDEEYEELPPEDAAIEHADGDEPDSIGAADPEADRDDELELSP
jgi:hypothetical protein